MEDALALETTANHTWNYQSVLILVVMEDALALYKLSGNAYLPES